MRRRVLIASVFALLALLAGVAAGDTVYTRDGKIYRGAATRLGNKVLIQTADGKTIELLAGQVVHISKDSNGVIIVPPPGSGGGPIKRVPRPPAASAVQPPVPPTRKFFSIDAANEPEPVIFMLMRQLNAQGTSGVLDVRRQLERWRALAHDRKRRSGAKWLTPKEFAQHRKTFIHLLAEAKEAERKAKENMRKYSSGTSSRYPTRKDQQRLPKAALNKLRLAVNSWGDPLIRGFLTGVLQYDSGSFAQAAAAFRTCCAEAPRVAGFYQGYGVALTKINQHKQALPAYVRMLRLRPDDKDAVRMLQDGFDNVPGGMATSLKAYREADTLLSQYEQPSGSGASTYRRYYSSRSVSWLMPGRGWRASRGTLPVPPYDRLSFRQCIGVPVGKGALLVDEAVVKDAVEVFVQIDAKTVVPAKVSRSSSYSSSKKKVPVRLSLAAVVGYTFTPLPYREDKQPAKGRKILAYGLGLYEEMGSRARLIHGEVKNIDDEGNLKVTPRLAPGEVTSPVLTTDGELIGFLAGRIDIKHDSGGLHRFVPVSALASILKRASSSRRSSSYSRAKRTVKPVAVEGSAFIVYAIVAEKFSR